MAAVVSDKVSGQTATVSGNNIVLSDPSTVTLQLSPDDIAAMNRSGNDLVIDVRNGQDVRIENFYGPEGAERSDLVLEDKTGNTWTGDYTDELANFEFTEAGVVDQLGGAAAAGAGGAGGASILGIAAALGLAAGGLALSGGGGGSDHDDNGPGNDTERPAAPTDLDVDDEGTILTGRGEPGTTVTVTNAAGETIGTGTVNDDGTFSIGLDPAQTDGGELDVTLTDAAGNVSDPAATTAPDLIAPDAPTDLSVADGGTVLTGRGEPGTTVTVTNAAGETIGTGTVNDDGTFSIGLEPAQTDGGALDVTLTDAAGNVSDPAATTAPDLIAPDAPTDLAVADGGTVLTGRGEPGTTVTATNAAGETIGTGTVNADGTFSIGLEPAQTDSGELDVTLTDAAGNVSEPGTALVPDPDAPAAPTDLVVADGGIEVSGRGEAGTSVTVTNAAGIVIGTGTVATDGTFDVAIAPPQIDGSQLSVTLTSDSGTSLPGLVAAPDLIVPEAPTDILVDGAGAVLTGRGETGTVATVTNSAGTVVGTVTVAGDGTFSVTLQPVQNDGGSLTVTLTDAAGNISPPAIAATPDLTGPDAATNVSVTADGVVLTGRGEPGSTVTITNSAGTVLGTGTVGPDGDFGITLAPPQTDGSPLDVVLTDAVGNPSDPTSVASPDLIAPNAPTDLAINDDGTSLTGRGEPGTTVIVTDADGVTIATGNVTADGTFNLALNPDQINGGELSAILEDAAGNDSAATTIIPQDFQAPQPATNLAVDDSGTVVSGRGEPGAFITVTTAAGAVIGESMVNPDGTFSVTVDPAQTNGGLLSVVLTDAADNASDPASVLAPNPDAPDVPTGVAIDADGLVVTGNGQANATVRVYDDHGNTVGEGIVNPDGTFSVTLEPIQTDGGELRVTIADANGTSQPYMLTAPDLLVPEAPTNVSVNEAGTVVTGRGEAGTTVTITNAAGTVVGTGEVGATGNFAVTLSPAQVDGGALSVSLSDAGSNQSPAVSLTSPDLTLPTAPADLVVSTDGTLLTGRGEPGARITAKNANGVVIGSGTVDTQGDFSVALDPPQVSGGQVSVVQEDTAGNISAPDTVLPADDTPPSAATGLTVNAAGTILSGQGEVGATVTVTNGAGTVIGTGIVTADGSFTLGISPAQTDGGGIQVVLADAAGNVSTGATVTAPDLAAPAAPADLAIVANGAILTGTGEANATVTIRNVATGAIIASGDVTPAGTFSIVLSPPLSNGENLQIVLTDGSGNVSLPGAITIPDLTLPTPPGGLAVNGSGTVVTGSGEAGATVTITNPLGQVVGTGIVAAGGAFTIGLSPAQANGENLTITLTDPAGNISLPGTVAAPDLTTPTAATGITVAADGAGLSGTAEAGTTVTVRDAGGTAVGSVTVAPDGTFTVPLNPPQTDGGPLQITVADGAGHVSAPIVVTAADQLAPADPTNLTISADGTQLIGMGEPGATVTVRLPDGTEVASGTVGTNGLIAITLDPDLSDGGNLQVVLTDTSGNLSGSVSVATPDLEAPLAPTAVVINPAQTVVSGSGEVDAIVVVRDALGVIVGSGEVGTNGTFSVTLTPPQTEAGQLQVTLQDRAGNVSTGAAVILFDVQPPATPTNLVAGADGLTLSGIGEAGAIVRVSDASGNPIAITNGTVAPDGTFTVTFASPLTGGETLQVTLTDAAGNTSVAGTALSVDLDAPDIPGNLALDADGIVLTGTGPANAAVSVTNAAGTVVGTTSVLGDGTFSITFDPPQADGGDLRITLSDNNGTSQPGFVTTPDLQAPDAPTALVVNASGTTLTGHAEAGATVTVTTAGGLEVGSVVVGTGGTFSVPLAPAQTDGGLLSVVVADADGNAAAAVTIPAADLIAPADATGLSVNAEGTVLSGTGEANATITVTNASGLVIGTGTVAPDGSISVPLSPAQTIGGTLSVVLTDTAGNVSGAATVAAPDDLAPDAPTALVVSADGLVLSGLGEAGATVTVRSPGGAVLGTAVVEGDGTFDVTLGPAQTDGSLLSVTQSDVAGNISGAATVAAPDEVAPLAADDLVVNATGTLMTGSGEVGATVTITNAAGTTVGQGVIGQDGLFSIGLSPAQIDGGTLSVGLADAAGNTSLPATTPAPDLIDPAAPTALVIDGAGAVVTGQGEVGSTVTVTNAAGTELGSVVIGAGGGFTVALTPPQGNGGLLTVVVIDPSGNLSDPATVLAPDFTPPPLADDLVVNPSGTELTGSGEAGATVTVTNAGGSIVGTGTVGTDGLFAIGLSPAQVDGGQLSVVLEDASDNISGAATVIVPGIDFALASVGNTAILDRTVTVIPEASPSRASDSQFDLLGLSIGSLASVNLASSSQPVVNFNVSTANNEIALDLTISGALGIGLLSGYTVIIERYQNGTWVRPTDLGNGVSNGVLDLDLLGLGATHTVLTLEDIPSGSYRATFVPDVGISIGVALTRDLSVTATDVTDQVHISVGENAAGNFITSSASGDLADLRVGSVTFEGTEHALVNGSLSLAGDYGTLTIQANGSYSYTPHTTAPDGVTDTFNVTVVDSITGNELNADLSIGIDIDDGSAGTFAASSDVVSLAFAEDVAIDDGSASATDGQTDSSTSDDASTVDVTLDSDGQEIDLSGLDNLSDDTSTATTAPAADASTATDLDLPGGDAAATVDLGDTATVTAVEPLTTQDDELAAQRLPVV